MNYNIEDSATERDDEDIRSTSTAATRRSRGQQLGRAAEADTAVWGIPVSYWGSGRADYTSTSGSKYKWYHEENGKATKTFIIIGYVREFNINIMGYLTYV